MANYLNSVDQSFESLANDKLYVDKSNLISILNEKINHPGSNCFAVSRPRRFGKSKTADMINAYYSRAYNSKDLFSKLEISKNPTFEEHLNRYDVLYLDISSMLQISVDNEETDFIKFFKTDIIKDLKKEYPNYISDDIKSIAVALNSIYEHTNRKFVIIIDEWDALFRERPKDVTLQEDFIGTIYQLFKGPYANRFLALGYITGILPLKQYPFVETKLNNFTPYTMIEPLDMAKYVGFTENEVRNLQHGSNVSFDDLQRWYDGYKLPDVGSVYNPNSVVHALDKNKCISYWGPSGTFKTVQDLIKYDFDGLKEAVYDLLSGKPVLIDPGYFQNDVSSFTSKDEILTFLVHLGYLSFDSSNSTVFIPNLEVKDEFKKAVNMIKHFLPLANALNQSDDLLDATLNKDEDKVASMLENIHEDKTPQLKYNSEESLASILMIAYYTACNYYIMKREVEAGKGRADVVFKPYKTITDKPAMVIELKWNKTTDSALTQIKERRYVKALDDYKGKVLLVSINYNSESKKGNYKHHSCKIEEIEV